MSELFQNKYRISSARLQNWDYSWPGMYFITICTADREHYFGEIENGTMKLSPVGAIADILWYEIKNHAKNVELGEYIVMPNHVHGILLLNDDDGDGGDDDVVETRHALSLPRHCRQYRHHRTNAIGTQRFQNQGKNTISSIVGGYKSAVTKHCNRLGFDFKWQSRFHDHIIRDEKSFHTISQYIINNPMNWKEDRFCPNGKA